VRRKQVLIWAVVFVTAFLVGTSGAPGQAVAAAAGWLAAHGHVELVGPVGDAVREML
jgi:hypothetical protein